MKFSQIEISGRKEEKIEGRSKDRMGVREGKKEGEREEGSRRRYSKGQRAVALLCILSFSGQLLQAFKTGLPVLTTVTISSSK